MNLSESNLQLKHRPSYTKIVNDRYEGEFPKCTGNLSQDNNAPNEKQPTMDLFPFLFYSNAPLLVIAFMKWLNQSNLLTA